MSTKEVEEIKERLTKLETGFENFKQFSAQIIKLEVNPIVTRLDTFEGHFRKLFEHMERTQVRCTNHSAKFETLGTSLEHRFKLHDEESKNKSLGLKLYLVGRDMAAFMAFSWFMFKQFLADKMG